MERRLLCNRAKILRNKIAIARMINKTKGQTRKDHRRQRGKERRSICGPSVGSFKPSNQDGDIKTKVTDEESKKRCISFIEAHILVRPFWCIIFARLLCFVRPDHRPVSNKILRENARE